MIFILITAILLISIRTIGYGIYEIKDCKNKFGGVFVIIFAIASAAFAISMILLRWAGSRRAEIG